ncbi:hypothetical protein CPB86DRAFT_602920 [Serendipita vermifera]|nr:hypothetical protein CPB86DRAFT_602920 [Serendipita vermifera]
MIKDTTQTTISVAQSVATKAGSTYPTMFSRDIDFTGPGDDSTSGAIDIISSTNPLASGILHPAVYAEATASSSEAKQTSSSASTAPSVVSLLQAYEQQTTSSDVASITTNPTNTVLPTSSSEAVKMPIYVVPAQAARQRLEKMASTSISDEFSTLANAPEATFIPNLKATTYMPLAPWSTSSMSSTDSILFNKNIQVLFIAFMLIATLLIGGLVYFIRFYWKRSQRARIEAAARAAITDDKIFAQDASLDEKEFIEQIEDYKRPSAPAGLEWQLRAMKENSSPRRSPKSRPTSIKPRDRVVSAPDHYTPRKSKRSELAAFVRNQEDDDDSSSIFDYYFNVSPAEDEAEIECTSRKSLDSSMEKEKQTINSSFERGDLAGQTINGFRLYLPLKPSPLRHGFVPL